MAMNKTETSGQIHLYTGNGKGKTTAAFGLAVRALCAGKTVYIGQFVKSMRYNETQLVAKFTNLRIEQFGCGCMLNRHATPEDLAAAQSGLQRCLEELRDESNDLVILDEICIAIHLGLLSEKDVLSALNQRHKNVEVVLTGRYATERLIEYADLVTEMKEVKHYYTTKGLLSRDGIDK